MRTIGRVVPVVPTVRFPPLPTLRPLMSILPNFRPCPAVAIALLLCSAGGCSRTFYRIQADQEAHGLMASKNASVARPSNRPLIIDVDPRSRMFNPFDADFQPIPVDDPASHRLMECVDNRRGYPAWDAAGITNTAENPAWWQFLPLDEDGVLTLNADNAVRIALLHSRDYQEQLETLYLSALDVSSERFRFDTQFFGGLQTNLTADGRQRGGFNGNSSTRLSTGLFSPSAAGARGASLERSFATGADLVVGVANNIVWELSGPNSQSATTVFDFALIQPLLRGAGRDIVLERLTLSERRLLSNVRNFERYRRAFYLNIITGQRIDTQVRRSGGVFGVGLGGFTGLGGGFAGLGSGSGGVLGGFGGGVPDAGGLFGLLQDQLQIRNLEENISRLGENVLLLESTLVELLTTIPDDPEAIVRQRLQIAQAKSSLLASQSTLVSRRAAYAASIDDFLRDLGLPPYLCVRVEDNLLERFELIDAQLRSRRAELVELRTAVGAINVSLLESSESTFDETTGTPRTTLADDEAILRQVAAVGRALQPLEPFIKVLVDEDATRVAADIALLADTLPQRRGAIDRLREDYLADRQMICSLLGLQSIDASIFDTRPLQQLDTELAGDLADTVTRLRDNGRRLAEVRESLAKVAAGGGRGAGGNDDEAFYALVRDEVILPSQAVLTDLAEAVLLMQLAQARARVETVELPPVDINPSEAFEIARVNRRDYANARASLVDSYRLIEFNADALESNLDVVFSGDVQNFGSNPLDLRSNTGRLRVGLQWDAPITRLQERNTYRQSLIEYEQSKRDFYNFEDDIWQLLRGEVRQLQANRFNFELGRQSVRIAASQIELNDDIRQLRDARGLSSGPTAARDTISALSDLLNSQNSLLNLFVNFEVVRRALDLDLGTMQLTPDGMWIDPGPINPDAMLQLVGTSQMGLIECREVSTPTVLPCGPGGCGLPPTIQPVEAIYGRVPGMN